MHCCNWKWSHRRRRRQLRATNCPHCSLSSWLDWLCWLGVVLSSKGVCTHFTGYNWIGLNCTMGTRVTLSHGASGTAIVWQSHSMTACTRLFHPMYYFGDQDQLYVTHQVSFPCARHCHSTLATTPILTVLNGLGLIDLPPLPWPYPPQQNQPDPQNIFSSSNLWFLRLHHQF